MQQSEHTIYRGIRIQHTPSGYAWPNEGWFPTMEACKASIDSAFACGELGNAPDDAAHGIA